MITYVNTVLVGKGVGTIATDPAQASAGQYIFMNLDGSINKGYLSAAELSQANEIKIGLVTSKSTKYTQPDGTVATMPVIKWSNNIKRADIKALTYSEYQPDVPETVVVDFNSMTQNVLHTIDDGGFCLTLRITYKDLPTRYRKWTDSYNYVTVAGDTAAKIAAGFAKDIAKNAKRSRVSAVVGNASYDATTGELTFTANANGTAIQLTALPYDDDDSVDSINWAGQVRFNANVYYTNPNGVGFTSKNKYSLDGVKITKIPGDMYTASAKLVRDREAQAMGYEGILNRGEGTWPIIKPAMQTDLSKQYDAVTLEFENMYRAADDIFRKTKQTVEIYEETGKATNIYNALKNFAGVDSDNIAPIEVGD